MDLKLVVQETGDLKQTFVILMSLEPAAARKLAATLTELADQVSQAQPGSPDFQ